MRAMSITRPLLGAVVALSACAPDRALERGTRRPTSGEVGGMHAVPVLTIAGDSGSGHPEFLGVVDAMRLSTGVIAVADRLRPSILLFDANGRLIRAVGRRGSGPSEFESLSWLLRCAGDSIYAFDAELDRMTVMDAAGGVVRHFRLPTPPFRLSCISGGVLAVLDRPRIIERMDPRGRAIRKYSGNLWLANAEGDTVGVIGEFDVGENRPLGRLTSIAIAKERVYVGTAESTTVDVYAFDGRRLSAIDIAVARREATARHYERAVDRMLEAFTDGGYREQMKRELLKIPRPDILPPYSDIVADVEGTLWAVISAPGDTVTQLRVIGADGHVRGDVTFPSGTRVLEVGPDYVLALEVTDVGEERIVLYEIRVG